MHLQAGFTAMPQYTFNSTTVYDASSKTNKIVHIKDGIIGQIEENLNHNASPFGSGGLMK